MSTTEGEKVGVEVPELDVVKEKETVDPLTFATLLYKSLSVAVIFVEFTPATTVDGPLNSTLLGAAAITVTSKLCAENVNVVPVKRLTLMVLVPVPTTVLV
jgi:hypothetical protein